MLLAWTRECVPSATDFSAGAHVTLSHRSMP